MKTPSLLLPALLAVGIHADGFSAWLFAEPDCHLEPVNTEISSDLCNEWGGEFSFRSFIYISDDSILGEPTQEIQVYANSGCDASNKTHPVIFPLPDTPVELEAGCATQPCRIFDQGRCYNVAASDESLPGMSILSFHDWATDYKCGPFWREGSYERCDNLDFYHLHPDKYGR